MPRATMTFDPKQAWTEAEYVLLQLLMAEINVLRAASGLPERTQEDIKHQALALVNRYRRTR